MINNVQIPVKYPVVSDPSILGGTPVIKGSRVPASLIADLISKQYTIGLISVEYPQLSQKKLTQFFKLISIAYAAQSKQA